MKELATLLIASVLISLTAGATSLEMSIGVGPSATSLGSVNASIGVFNALITHLNETFESHPDVTGTVETLSPLTSGLALSAAERFWLADWFALGAGVEYFGTSTETIGYFEGADISTIDVGLDVAAFNITIGGRATFLDMGLKLAADAGIAYHYVVSNAAVAFEVPSEYPGTISGVPPTQDGRYTGDTFGFELGLTLFYPIAPWFTLGASVGYRSATIDAVTDASGTELDLDGDGSPEPFDLDGISVRLTLSFNIDLSIFGEKE